MEAAPAAATSAAPASPPPAATTTAAAASPTPPAGATDTKVTVNANGTPGTTTPPAAAEGKWTDAFDSDLKDYVSQKGFQDPKAVIESYRNLEKLRGVPQDRLLKLPDQPEDKAWDDVYSKLGKPATPEGYGFKPKDPNNSGFTDWAKNTFHKLNLTETQGKELVKQFADFQQQGEVANQEKYTAAVQEQTGKLKKEWGAAFNQNVNRARQAYRQFGIPDAAVDSLEKSIGFDGVMKMFHNLGTSVGEHTFISGDGGANFHDVVLTPEQANARIKALKQDADWAGKYLKGGVKEKAEMERLIKMANPG